MPNVILSGVEEIRSEAPFDFAQGDILVFISPREPLVSFSFTLSSSQLPGKIMADQAERKSKSSESTHFVRERSAQR